MYHLPRPKNSCRSPPRREEASRSTTRYSLARHTVSRPHLPRRAAVAARQHASSVWSGREILVVQSPRHLLQQAQDLLLRFLQFRVELLRRPRWRVLAEVSVETDLVADLVFAAVHPGAELVEVRLALEVGIPATAERCVSSPRSCVREGSVPDSPSMEQSGIGAATRGFLRSRHGWSGGSTAQVAGYGAERRRSAVPVSGPLVHGSRGREWVHHGSSDAKSSRPVTRAARCGDGTAWRHRKCIRRSMARRLG